MDEQMGTCSFEYAYHETWRNEHKSIEIFIRETLAAIVSIIY